MGKKLTTDDFKRAATKIGCDVNVIKAVAIVESASSGFDPEGFPKTLFEGHVFYKLTEGRYAVSHPNLCHKLWDKSQYGKTWKQEKERLNLAISLERKPALKSASWGLFQILGKNYRLAGFESIQKFVNAMCTTESEHLNACVNFIINIKADYALRTKNWTDFARLYNGVNFAVNKYHIKLENTYNDLIKKDGK